MKRKELTQKERFKLQKLLETVLEENGELYDYKPGWSDVRVAQECGMTSNTVKNTRTKTFGVLYRQQPEPKSATRIVALEAQVAQLQVQMAAVLEALTLRDPDLFQQQKVTEKFIMPLNLDLISTGSHGGQFYDKLRFNAQGGVWFMKSQDGEKRFPNGFKAVFDMENLQTGWSKYNGTYVDFIADPSLENAAPKPAETSDDEDKWKRGFKVLAYSKDTFAGTLEFMHQARTVTVAFNELYSQYESKAEAGKLPVVSVDGDPEKVGDYYGPAWKIVKMVDRPAEMGAMPEEETPAAAPVAAAATDVPTDDEF